MARQCTICNHPERTAIETAIVSNEKYQEISKRFDISISAIGRHKDNHLKAAIQSVQRKQAEQTAHIAEAETSKQEHFAWDVLARMGWLDRQVRLVYEKTTAEGDHKASLQAIGEYRQQTKLFSELLEGQEPGQAERLEQEWILLRETIFAVLDPYPDVQLAMTRALLALKSNHDYQSDRQLLPEESTTKPDSNG